MGKYQEFTRKELYDLVWSTPMTKLAKLFGISDVGLRKICVKHNIPTPPLGYWAKLSFGKPVEQAALGPAGDNVRDKVSVALSAAMDLPEDAVTAEVEAPKSIPTQLRFPLIPLKTCTPSHAPPLVPSGQQSRIVTSFSMLRGPVLLKRQSAPPISPAQ
jgi:hypothetical protein